MRTSGLVMESCIAGLFVGVTLYHFSQLKVASGLGSSDSMGKQREWIQMIGVVEETEPLVRLRLPLAYRTYGLEECADRSLKRYTARRYDWAGKAVRLKVVLPASGECLMSITSRCEHVCLVGAPHVRTRPPIHAPPEVGVWIGAHRCCVPFATRRLQCATDGFSLQPCSFVA